MKILLLNNVYKEGSTGKIVDGIATTLRSQGHEVLTCYGLGSEYYDDYSRKICSNFEHRLNAFWKRISGIPFGGYYRSNHKIEKIIEHFHPDVVHVHCVNASTMNVYRLFSYLGKKHIKTVLTLHAEIFHTAGCEHAFECEKWKTGCHNCNVYKNKVDSWFFDRSSKSYNLIKKAFGNFSSKNLIITAVSPWLANRARQSAILQGFQVEYVPNGVDTKVFNYRQPRGLIDRGHFKKVVLYVTPYFGFEETDIKGGHFVPVIAEKLPEALFVVVSMRASVQQPQLPANVLLWGKARCQEELATLYSEADVTLLLSKRETFSMVTVESLCCGTPVVGFLAGGPESIVTYGCAKFVDQGDTQKIIKVIQEFTVIDRETVSRTAIASYSKEVMADKYMLWYNTLITR